MNFNELRSADNPIQTSKSINIGLIGSKSIIYYIKSFQKTELSST